MTSTSLSPKTRPARWRRLEIVVWLMATAVLCQPLRAYADAEPDPKVAEARTLFTKGAELAKGTQWAEALTAFERSAELRPHAVTTYNVGSCLRAMGRYTRARLALLRAIDQNTEAGGDQLSASLLEETKGWLVEIDGLLSTLELEIVPTGASLAIDGRPLERPKKGDAKLLAGTRPPGPAEAVPEGTFSVRLDPGTHVLTITRAGYSERVVTETLASGSTKHLRLELDKMPGTLRITSSQDASVVTVNGLDVGVAPVELSRPAGSYSVLVRRNGYLAFKSEVAVKAGERTTVLATLREDKPALTERWWFWTAVGVAVVGAATTTYFVTRPAPERPAPNGGSLGWVVSPITFGK